MDETNNADEEVQIESNLISDADYADMQAQVEMQNLLDSPERLDALADRLGTSDLTIEQVQEEAYRLLAPDPSTDDRD